MDHQSLISCWEESLQRHRSTTTSDQPNYYAAAPSQLITTSLPQSFAVGSGHQILASVIPICLSTRSELLIVTCFIARSPSLNTYHDLLIQLSQRAVSLHRRIRVRLCFSSSSLLQKLFHTASLDGRVWLPSEWPSLGLPRREEVAGLELVVKSVFVRPFSVMHPKFILVDRRVAVVPSANLSWEEWFEGAVVMRGDVCEGLVKFWQEVWGRGGEKLPVFELPSSSSSSSLGDGVAPDDDGQSIPHGLGDERLGVIRCTELPSLRTQPPTPVTTIILPSPHHRNPSFRPFFPSRPIPPPPPPTPLNLFLLHLLHAATTSITINTPNLTSAPVTRSLLSALERGVHVRITTSRRLMILEQLATAGTLTELEIWRLRRRYRALLGAWERRKHDVEAATRPPGQLTIRIFKDGRRRRGPRDGIDDDDEGGAGMERAAETRTDTYTAKAHLKMVIVDDEVTVLGSGNMDRASWWTSQELGVAFFSREMAREVRDCVEGGLEGRLDVV